MPLISLRDNLTGAVVDLLRNERMACVHTQDGLVTVINALALYREEGRALFPEVFILDNLPLALSALPHTEHVIIGSGPRDAATMAKGLKQCAPLAQGGWAVFIHREPAGFSYGLIRCGVHNLSLPLSNLLIENGDPQIPALMARQLAENVVEVRGVGGASLLVHFGASRSTHVSPADALKALVACVVVKVDNSLKEQTSAFYERLFSRALKASHGTLVAVQPANRRVIPPALRDGVILRAPIRIVEPVSELLEHEDCLANTRLQAAGALILGMLLSDGITVFGSDGSVRAYNIFIKHPRSRGQQAQPSGGARRRTFDTLCSMIGKGLDCVFMQSQDGAVDFK